MQVRHSVRRWQGPAGSFTRAREACFEVEVLVAWRALCKHLATSFGQSVACAASGSYCSKERPAGELGAGVRSMST